VAPPWPLAVQVGSLRSGQVSLRVTEVGCAEPCSPSPPHPERGCFGLRRQGPAHPAVAAAYAAACRSRAPSPSRPGRQWAPLWHLSPTRSLSATGTGTGTGTQQRRTGQVGHVTRPKSRTMSVTRRLGLATSEVRTVVLAHARAAFASHDIVAVCATLHVWQSFRKHPLLRPYWRAVQSSRNQSCSLCTGKLEALCTPRLRFFSVGYPMPLSEEFHLHAMSDRTGTEKGSKGGTKKDATWLATATFSPWQGQIGYARCWRGLKAHLVRC
jgi:hypothetical protein